MIIALGVAACSDEPPEEQVEEPPNAIAYLGCGGICHGDEYSVAPPRGLFGEVDTTETSVGAHRSHLKVAPTWHRQLECSDCHVVPENADDPAHIDGDNVAELTFGPYATGNGQATPTWNGTTCANAYCHGGSLQGGARTTPEWTQVDGTYGQCGSCHGAPPPPPHPAGDDCGSCHPTMQPGGALFLDPASHINGQVDVAPQNEQPCYSCHGSGTEAAPPTDLDGNTTPNYPGVGAHRAHIGESDWHRQLYCAQCHIVPVSADTPGHRDGDGQAEVYFDNLNPAADYSVADNTCSNMYCHSNGYGQLGTKTWTDEQPLNCDSCHVTNGEGRSGEHADHYQRDVACVECHNTVINNQGNIIGPEYHINGLHEVYFEQGGVWDAAAKTCTVNQACHPNTRNW